MKRRVTVTCDTHRHVSTYAISRTLTGLAVALTVAAVTGFSSWVHAQDLNTVPGLQERLDHERSVVEQLLNEGECPRACLALEAMRQAADRLCKLDAGRPGKDARDKLEKTAGTVKRACPDCEEAQEILHVRKGAPSARANVACAAAPPASGSEGAPKKKPPKVREGGCAACSVGAMPLGDNGTAHVGLSLLAIACIGRRRRRG